MSDFIPVAAISDLLLSPGEEFDYDGRRLTYPDIRLVYWAGGNPFHHHQDLPRLRRAFARPDTIVVHDPYWTPMARSADIVVPSTTSLERNDLSCTRNDPLLVAMQQVVPPFANSRDDYDTFADLASALGFGEQFTEGRSSQEWIEHLYDQWRPFVDADGGNTPTFEDFWSDGHYRMRTEDNLVLFGDFREDPRSIRSRLRVGRSRSSPRPSSRSATPTAPAIRAGTSPTSGWADRGPRNTRFT